MDYTHAYLSKNLFATAPTAPRGLGSWLTMFTAPTVQHFCWSEWTKTDCRPVAKVEMFGFRVFVVVVGFGFRTRLRLNWRRRIFSLGCNCERDGGRVAESQFDDVCPSASLVEEPLTSQTATFPCNLQPFFEGIERTTAGSGVSCLLKEKIERPATYYFLRLKHVRRFGAGTSEPPSRK